MAAVQPRPEGACDGRDLVDLDCSNPTVDYDRRQPPGQPRYCFGLRLPRAMVAPLLRDPMPGNLCEGRSPP
jgi:hypothetical protein